ncbi:MAG: hypothetical protein LH650_13140 [Chloroflexi bacterium]|nr:hypothetical protein [Chloroflexota bacterium]
MIPVLVVALIWLGAVAFVLSRLWDVSLPGHCLTAADEACEALIDVFNQRANEASLFRGLGAGLFAVLVGLALGTPIVAGEVEDRTALLAWSLGGDRIRWLARRLAFMLSLAVLVLVALGVGQLAIHQASRPGLPPTLDYLGSSGVSLVARGIMAMAIALFIGSLVGRNLPTFLVAGSVAVIIAMFALPALHRAVSGPLAERIEIPYLLDSGDFADQPRRLYQIEEWLEDKTGVRYEQEEFALLYNAHAPDSEQWMADNVMRIVSIVPTTAYTAVELVDVGASLCLGAVCLLGTAATVKRRRVT